MQNIKVGDRVRVNDSWNGTVIGLDEGTTEPYCVMIDGDKEHSWWSEGHVELLTPSAKQN